MAESASGQDEASPVFPLATRAGKRGSSYPLGISRVGPARTSYLLGHTINPLMTKLGSFLALLSTLVNKKAKKNLANQYPAILTSRSVNNAHIY